ncbi:hypothetical protein Xmau_04392 [Xenorhabdus mauleonii]|uniref:Uncharacterized protein n=1 Tax=Xenorhabdus mauleonii TaxID=351675 RepID=A0A1I3Y3E8_9GAMM|nr:hypothetical protein [Xenorhabdus mauleonii]PHM35991.1 hypothetical protein Xmau_04392 [Xenorhabdus mauleonii]SFK26292.1 hypothetical protein SAMN05421680_14314 [Xenorhabdus mauleonii]
MKTKGKISILMPFSGSFNELVKVIELILRCDLSIKDMDGRYVAEGNINKYKIQLVDKEDRSLEILSDEYHTLSFYLYDNCENDINEIINILNKNTVIWDKAILIDIKEEGDYRVIYPH